MLVHPLDADAFARALYQALAEAEQRQVEPWEKLPLTERAPLVETAAILLSDGAVTIGPLLRR